MNSTCPDEPLLHSRGAVKSEMEVKYCNLSIFVAAPPLLDVRLMMWRAKTIRGCPKDRGEWVVPGKRAYQNVGAKPHTVGPDILGCPTAAAPDSCVHRCFTHPTQTLK